MENEEPQKTEPWKLRPQKLRQMMAARKTMAKSRGGREAIYAALTILTAEGKVTLTDTPSRPHNKGPWMTWVADSTKWMVKEGWIQGESTAANMTHEAEQKTKQRKGQTHLAVDVGEGWGSVRRALQALQGVEVVGIDRRGHTNTGVKHGVITAAVNHDLTIRGKEDLFTTIAKKVGRAVRNWALLWMSLECSSMSIANAINQATGSAHGKWASSAQNKGQASEERLGQEEEYLRESIEVLRNVVEALEAHPNLSFALENPATSQTWEADVIREATRRNPEWKLIRVDQCAYGRMSQKPTCILTNLKNWAPRGQTGNGKCKPGQCAGTMGNVAGSREHKEQTVPNSKEKRPSQGQRTGARYDYVKEAVTNAVAAPLVQEIMGAAITARGEEKKKKSQRAK
jgi:hypothetical protein